MRITALRRPLPVLACLVGVLALGPARGGAQPPPSVWGLDFSPDGSLVLVGGYKFRVFDATTGKKVYEGGVEAAASQAAFLARGPGCVVWHSDKVFRVWSPMKPVREIDPMYPPTVNPGEDRDFRFALDSGGKFLARSFSRYGARSFFHPVGGDVRVWDLETGKPIRRIEVDGGGAQGLAFSDDGSRLAFVQPRDPKPTTLEVYSTATWKPVASVALPSGPFKENPFGTLVRFAPGGNRLLAAGGVAADAGPGEFRGSRSWRTHRLLWSVELGKQPTAKLLGDPRPHADPYRALAVSPDGKAVAVSGDGPGVETNYRARIEVREAVGGKVVWTADGVDPMTDLKFSPDGALLGCIGNDQARLLDARTGKLVRTIDASK